MVDGRKKIHFTRSISCPLVTAWHLELGPLRWRLNERHGVSNRRRLDALLNPLFRCWSKKTSKLRVTGLCDGGFTGNSPHRVSVTRKIFQIDYVVMHQWPKHCCGYPIIYRRKPKYVHIISKSLDSNTSVTPTNTRQPFDSRGGGGGGGGGGREGRGGDELKEYHMWDIKWQNIVLYGLGYNFTYWGQVVCPWRMWNLYARFIFQTQFMNVYNEHFLWNWS